MNGDFMDFYQLGSEFYSMLILLRDYSLKYLTGAFQGDLASIIIIFLVFTLVIGFVLGIWVFGLIRRILIMAVLAFSVYMFFNYYIPEIMKIYRGEVPMDPLIITFAVLYVLIVYMIGAGGVRSFLRHSTKKKISKKPSVVSEGPATSEGGKTASQSPATAQAPEVLKADVDTSSLQQLINSFKEEKSILKVFGLILITEIGIFSSKTFAAPNYMVGIGFFCVFVVGAFILIKGVYVNYKQGLMHLGVALVLAWCVAMVFGFFWQQIPLETLFSIHFFETDALVGVVTGVAVSILMGGKG